MANCRWREGWREGGGREGGRVKIIIVVQYLPLSSIIKWPYSNIPAIILHTVNHEIHACI